MPVFFSERCYLPQATLGRLLEVYDDKKTGSNSPLTLFVKELLGLDPLDALVDGLDYAFNVTRVRKLVPDFVHLEKTKVSLDEERRRLELSINDATRVTNERLVQLNETLKFLARQNEALLVNGETDLNQLKIKLDSASDTDQRITDLSRVRSELRGLQERWKSISSVELSHDQAGKEKADQLAADALNSWWSSQG